MNNDDNVYLVLAREAFGKASALSRSKDKEQMLLTAQVAVLIAIAEELQGQAARDREISKSLDEGEAEANAIHRATTGSAASMAASWAEVKAKEAAAVAAAADTPTRPIGLPYGLKHGKDKEK
jgi:hypothetical protein